MFAENRGIEVRRIALNMDQVKQYNPPPNPAKEKDSRSAAYISKYGRNSWELDALKPSVLNTLITDTIDEYRDQDIWDATRAKEEEARRDSGLAALSENWPDIRRFMREKGMI